MRARKLLYHFNLKTHNSKKIFFEKIACFPVKMVLCTKRLSHLISSLFLVSFLFSCKSDSAGVNSVFQERYGKEVEKIKVERLPPLQNALSNNKVVFNDKVEQDWRDQESNDSYAYMDPSKLDPKQVPQEFLPNSQVYQNSQSGGNLPNDMFVVTYNTELSPPFVRYGVEFDRIIIPESDAYGVKTEMSDKVYVLAGNDSLQKNIDVINAQRTRRDIENSEILIAEQKRLRREQKSKKIFGNSSSELVVVRKKEEPEKRAVPKVAVVVASEPPAVLEETKEEKKKKSGLAKLLVESAKLN